MLIGFAVFRRILGSLTRITYKNNKINKLPIIYKILPDRNADYYSFKI